MSLTIKFNYTKYYETLKENILSKINILHIFLVTLALHFFVMSTPADGKIFDEAHYIPASISTLHGIAANAEHTPLSKIVLGWSIGGFGDWWFGWRITPVLFGSLSIIMVYLIAKHFMSRKYALFASAFIALDMLFFVNNSIAILDPQAMFFALFGVVLLLKAQKVKQLHYWVFSAVSFGVAVLSNEIAVMILGGVGIYLLIKNTRNFKLTIHFKLHKPQLKQQKPALIFCGLFFLLVIGGVYAYDIAYKPSSQSVLQTNVAATVYVDGNNSAISTAYSTTNMTSYVYITNPLEHFLFAFNYYRGLVPTINPGATDYRPPWSWAYPLTNAWNPPQYYGVSVSSGSVVTHTVSYFSQISYPITVFLIPTLALCIWYLWKKKEDNFPAFYIGWVFITYTPWLLLGSFVQKMTFNYYFIYTVPILNIGAPWFIRQLPLSEKWKTLSLVCLLLVTGVYFLYYFPINIFRA
jgi:hypothetical protein